MASEEPRPREPLGGPDYRSIVGGVRAGLIRATWPMGRLVLDRDWIEISFTGGDLIPPVKRRRGDVRLVRVHRGIMTTKVRVVRSDGTPERTVFLALGSTEVEAALENYGWPVEFD